MKIPLWLVRPLWHNDDWPPKELQGLREEYEEVRYTDTEIIAINLISAPPEIRNQHGFCPFGEKGDKSCSRRAPHKCLRPRHLAYLGLTQEGELQTDYRSRGCDVFNNLLAKEEDSGLWETPMEEE